MYKRGAERGKLENAKMLRLAGLPASPPSTRPERGMAAKDGSGRRERLQLRSRGAALLTAVLANKVQAVLSEPAGGGGQLASRLASGAWTGLASSGNWTAAGLRGGRAAPPELHRRGQRSASSVLERLPPPQEVWPPAWRRKPNREPSLPDACR